MERGKKTEGNDGDVAEFYWWLGKIRCRFSIFLDFARSSDEIPIFFRCSGERNEQRAVLCLLDKVASRFGFWDFLESLKVWSLDSHTFQNSA